MEKLFAVALLALSLATGFCADNHPALLSLPKAV
jgi:hypothetical protein